jgi:hypothetical protein
LRIIFTIFVFSRNFILFPNCIVHTYISSGALLQIVVYTKHYFTSKIQQHNIINILPLLLYPWPCLFKLKNYIIYLVRGRCIINIIIHKNVIWKWIFALQHFLFQVKGTWSILAINLTGTKKNYLHYWFWLLFTIYWDILV